MSPDDRAHAAVHPSASSTTLPRSALPPPRFDHLRRLTDRHGLWEHAEMSTPRREHGFCTDDNARALVVVSRHESSEDLSDLAAIYLQFVLDARTTAGGFHNRRRADGAWIDEIGSDDCQGRAWWALGAAARSGPAAWMRVAGADAFTTCYSFESPHLRSNAYAALGAVEMLRAHPGHPAATDLLDRTAGVIVDAARRRIPWPEARLTYANARLPEALLAAGSVLGDPQLISVGTRLLRWLVEVEAGSGRFSFTPAGGWSQGETRPGFDQQPIEAWAMAEACHRAWAITGDPMWRERSIAAGRWFMGENEIGMVLYDPATGATGDGLMEHSVNQNRGAESTLAGIATLQVGTWGRRSGLKSAGPHSASIRRYSAR